MDERIERPAAQRTLSDKIVQFWLKKRHYDVFFVFGIVNKVSYNNSECTVMSTKNFTSGSISFKKLYGRFQFQVKNILHTTVQMKSHNNYTIHILQYFDFID
jgi:hypothetical protein